MKLRLTNILIIIFAAIFLVSGYFLVDYFLQSKKQQSQFDELAAIMEQATTPTQPPQEAAPILPDAVTPTDATEPTVSAFVQVQDPETGEMVEVLPEFAQLYEMNNHIVGWIRIDGTSINYPVMQTPGSPNYYLNRDYEKNYSRQGCIYVREECDVFAPSDNLTIYGHRMGDGTMFNDLHEYASKSFWQEHRYITFNTLTQHRTYEILYVFRIASEEDSPFLFHLFVDAADRDHFDSYIENCRALALYDTGMSAQYGDKLISLCTCEYSQVNGRLVVVARQIDPEP